MTRKQGNQRGLRGAGLVLLFAASANAAITPVTNRAALAANDAIVWDSLVGVVITSPTAVESIGGLEATVSCNGYLAGETEGSNWTGNFGPNAPILFTGQFGPAAPIVLTFSSPVSAVGAQMNYNVVASPSNAFPFVAVLSLYNGSGKLLARLTAKGEQYFKADNSAVFIGGVDTKAEISEAVFSTTTTGGPFSGSFAINDVSLTVP